VGTDPQHRHIKHPYPILDPLINHIGGIHIVHKIFTHKQADTFKIGTAVVEVKHVEADSKSNVSGSTLWNL